MAELRKNILGQLSGTVGNTVFRIRNGKSIVYTRPREYNMSTSENLKDNRSRFALTVSFAKFINNIPLLKQTWKEADIGGTNAYQRIIKHNAGKNTSKFLTKNNIVTPPGTPLIIEEVHFDISEIILLLKMCKEFPLLTAAPFSILLVIFFFEPIQTNNSYYSFYYSCKSMDYNITDTEFSISFPVDDECLDYMTWFNKNVLYAALVKKDPITQKLLWSSTGVKERD